MDTMRTGCYELISNKKKYRPYFILGIIVLMFFLGIGRCFRPWGYYLDFWLRHEIGGLVFRAIIASVTLVSLSFFYGERNVVNDISMFVKTNFISSAEFFGRSFKLPIVLTALFLLAAGLAEFAFFKRGWVGKGSFRISAGFESFGLLHIVHGSLHVFRSCTVGGVL